VVGSILRCFLEIVEGASLLRSRLNYLFNALHWQVEPKCAELTIFLRLICHEKKMRTLSRVKRKREPWWKR
jgi:hypothetical protein